MSVADNQLKLFASTTMATSFATANVGGGISGTEILAAVVGEVCFMMAADPDDDVTQYAKAHFANTNTTDTLTDAKIWMPNAGQHVAGNYPCTAQSASEDDDETKKIRFLGYDVSSDPLQHELTMNGTTEAIDSIDFSVVHGAELRNSTTGILTNAAGPITLRRNGTVFGVIPAGCSSMQNEISIGLGEMDDTATIDDAGTPPDDVTFSRPRTYEDGLAVDGDDVPAESAQSIWFEWIQPRRRKPSPDMLCLVGMRGSST